MTKKMCEKGTFHNQGHDGITHMIHLGVKKITILVKKIGEISLTYLGFLNFYKSNPPPPPHTHTQLNI